MAEYNELDVLLFGDPEGIIGIIKVDYHV